LLTNAMLLPNMIFDRNKKVVKIIF
jgi:hypothetical protein